MRLSDGMNVGFLPLFQLSSPFNSASKRRLRGHLAHQGRARKNEVPSDLALGLAIHMTGQILDFTSTS